MQKIFGKRRHFVIIPALLAPGHLVRAILPAQGRQLFLVPLLHAFHLVSVLLPQRIHRLIPPQSVLITQNQRHFGHKTLISRGRGRLWRGLERFGWELSRSLHQGLAPGRRRVQVATWSGEFSGGRGGREGSGSLFLRRGDKLSLLYVCKKVNKLATRNPICHGGENEFEPRKHSLHWSTWLW